MRVTWLADTLRQSGVEVVELAGWQGRGRSMQEVKGVVWHHTVTGPDSPDRDVANLLRDGHSRLPGPLSQLGLDRKGRFWLIADGLCNHNGKGLWGNQSIGIEAFNSGTGEPWSDAQYRSWVTGTRAICKRVGLLPSKVMGHKETDPNRKIDPAGIDMNKARRDIAHPKKEDYMIRVWYTPNDPARFAVLYVGEFPVLRWHIKNANDAAYYAKGGVKEEAQPVSVIEAVPLAGAVT